MVTLLASPQAHYPEWKERVSGEKQTKGKLHITPPQGYSCGYWVHPDFSWGEGSVLSSWEVSKRCSYAQRTHSKYSRRTQRSHLLHFYVLDYSSTCTLDRLVGASSSESLNTAVLRRMGKFKHPIYRIWHAVHLRQLEILYRTSTPLYATCLRASTSITTRQS